MQDGITFDWHAEAATIDKWDADQVAWAAARLGVTPPRVTSGDMRRLLVTAGETTEPGIANLLLLQGQNAILSLILGLNSLTLYDNAHAYLGVGDGTTAVLATQTNLQGTNTAWAAVNASNPAMDAGSTITTATIAADFASGVAEWVGGWQEWALGNAASTGGRVLNRAVGVIGTGKSSELWTLNVTLGLGG